MCGGPKMLESWSWIFSVILKKGSQRNILVILMIKSVQWFNQWPANNDFNFVWKPHLNPHRGKFVPVPTGLWVPPCRVLELAHIHSGGQLHTSLHSTISNITRVAWNGPWRCIYTTEIVRNYTSGPLLPSLLLNICRRTTRQVGAPVHKTAWRHSESESMTDNMLQGK